MDFLKWLAELRTPLGDWLMSAVTRLGEEALFIVLALTVFWCVDKKRGYFLLFTGFVGMVCNQLLKMIFRIPRPWVLDPDFTIVESAREQATGYSFPSGHTQIATTLYGGIARTAGSRAVRIAGVLICLLVAFSRMYLGVHTPADVLVSLAIGAVLVLGLWPVFDRLYRSSFGMLCLILVVLLLAVCNLAFVQLYPFPADVDAANLADARSVAWKMLGMILAMCILYPVDRMWLRFETSAVLWAQILKVALGFGIVMALRLGLKTPLNQWLGESLGGAARYFLMVIVAGIVIPFFFRFLPKPREEAAPLPAAHGSRQTSDRQ